MAVGCDLVLLTPWDRVFEFRLGFDFPFCLFEVACGVRVLEMIQSCIQRPVSRITYLKENSFSCFYSSYFPPPPPQY